MPVLFTYRTLVPVDPPPLTDPDLLAAVPGCVHHNSARGGVYVLEGSWAADARFPNPSGDCYEGCSWVVVDVPAGVEHVVRTWDLGLCQVDPLSSPVAHRTLFANGVELTRVVDHPSGMRGAAFVVALDGTVSP